MSDLHIQIVIDYWIKYPNIIYIWKILEITRKYSIIYKYAINWYYSNIISEYQTIYNFCIQWMLYWNKELVSKSQKPSQKQGFPSSNFNKNAAISGCPNHEVPKYLIIKKLGCTIFGPNFPRTSKKILKVFIYYLACM